MNQNKDFLVTLINPPQIFTESQVATGVTPPLGVAYIASYLLHYGHKVNIIDALGEDPAQINSFKKGAFLRGLSFGQIVENIDKKTKLIGISNLFSFAYPAVEDLISIIKKVFPEIQIILGGPHPSALFSSILEENENVDYVAIGEGEQTTLELIRALSNDLPLENLSGLAIRDKNGNVVRLTPAKRITALDSEKIPYPARHLLPMEKYIDTQESHGATNGRWVSMLSSRGCPYGCTFCASRKTRWVSRNANDVVNEIEHCIKEWDIQEFHFEDDNMTMDKDRMIEICDEIIRRKLKIRWQTPNGIRASRTNADMLKKMKESGCVHITLAPESGSNRVLEKIIKKGSDFDLEHLMQCGKDAHKAGLKVAAYFVLGLPGETQEDIEETIQFSKELAKVGVDEVAFGLFIPLPGTPLWEASKHSVNNFDWLDLLVIGDLNRAISFNDEIDSNTLNKLRRKAYFTFLFFKAIYHPMSIVKSVINIIRNIEETKAERVILSKLGRKKRKLKGANVMTYDSSKAINILMSNRPNYSYKNFVLKAFRLAIKEGKEKTRSILIKSSDKKFTDQQRKK